MAICHAMGQRQLEFWDDRVEQDPQLSSSAVNDLSCETRKSTVTLVRDPVAYISLKRVSLIHEGSIRTRPSLSNSAEAMQFFARYWSENPANDQEKFVVACLDTKHRVQCVVVVTVGTLVASLIHPREVFKPAIIEGASGCASPRSSSGPPRPLGSVLCACCESHHGRRLGSLKACSVSLRNPWLDSVFG